VDDSKPIRDVNLHVAESDEAPTEWSQSLQRQSYFKWQIKSKNYWIFSL